jgi:hypothetical protein
MEDQAPTMKRHTNTTRVDLQRVSIAMLYPWTVNWNQPIILWTTCRFIQEYDSITLAIYTVLSKCYAIYLMFNSQLISHCSMLCSEITFLNPLLIISLCPGKLLAALNFHTLMKGLLWAAATNPWHLPSDRIIWYFWNTLLLWTLWHYTVHLWCLHLILPSQKEQ